MRNKIFVFLIVVLVVSLFVVTSQAKKEGEYGFARLTIIQMEIDKIDEGIKLFKESVMPAAKSQKGYVGVLLLTDRKTGKNISISLWESEEDAIANEKSGYYQEQVAKFKDIFTAPPVREGYEVTIKD